MRLSRLLAGTRHVDTIMRQLRRVGIDLDAAVALALDHDLRVNVARVL